MIDSTALALTIRGVVAVLLAIGGFICLWTGTRLLFKRRGQEPTSTTFEAKLGGHNISFSAGTAGTAVVLTSAVWVVGAILALPSFTSREGDMVNARSVITVPFQGVATALSAAQRAALDAVAQTVRQAAATNQLVVASHAEVGSPEENTAIAEKRGEAIKEYLVQEHGIPAGNVQVWTQEQNPFGVSVTGNDVAVVEVPK